MWSVVSICLLLSISTALGQKNITSFKDNKTVAADYSQNDFSKAVNEMKVTELGFFLDDMVDWALSAKKYINENSGMLGSPQIFEKGRKLKYKKGKNEFMMKAFLIFKTVLALFFPLGVIASKILSWKAVTLSLMAFMLAKILFIKNLLSGKNLVSVTPTNFVPPYFVQNGPNDLFWKRQGEAQNAFTWTQT